MADEKNPEVKEKAGFDFKIVLVGLLIFLVAMGASYFMLKSLMAPFMPEEKKEVKKEKSAGTIVSIGEFTTNLNDPTGSRFVKVEIYVELAGEKKKEEELKEYMPIMKDTVLGILSSKTPADMDIRYREELKQEIKNKLNKRLGKEMIKEVYFTSFIMQ
ncbi:flagellar FliL protein [Thermosyntropha lipolytica DSM 11003]|uniref:Flagellar protein FliL n=1 Tax=Thermosyntropha lipolytica DSM 11003 TaxID=1123382 RepID=A0A1M5KZ23_9FIRM|nr:flagellar basal body-associated FliL family protein [Thermosyntropha lipolytica]SHG58048.1 flagellar FliL protein [Thermosyntropha lipolytica DSM 11003]